MSYRPHRRRFSTQTSSPPESSSPSLSYLLETSYSYSLRIRRLRYLLRVLSSSTLIIKLLLLSPYLSEPTQHASPLPAHLVAVPILSTKRLYRTRIIEERSSSSSWCWCWYWRRRSRSRSQSQSRSRRSGVLYITLLLSKCNLPIV